MIDKSKATLVISQEDQDEDTPVRYAITWDPPIQELAHLDEEEFPLSHKIMSSIFTRLILPQLEPREDTIQESSDAVQPASSTKH